MQRFNRRQFKQKGNPKAGQVGRPRGGQKKAVLPLEDAQALARQKINLEKRRMRVLLKIRRSGEPDLSDANAKRYEQIGEITELIREIDKEIQGYKTQKPRYGRRPNKKS